MFEYNSKLDSAYDQSTFLGRLYHFQKMINPLNMLYSDAQILETKKTLENLPKENKYTNQELWNMKYVCLSNLHPDTQKPLNPLFKVSAFVPVNIPIIICLGMIAPTPINQIFSQTLNQTYNFGFNFANRNASNSFSNQQIATAYAGCVFFACTASVGSQILIKKSNLKCKNLLLKISPIFGVLSANLFNLFSTRYKDFITGIQVKSNENQQTVEGTSIKAAKIAFFQSAFLRVVLPIGVIFIPQFLQYQFEKRNLMPKNKLGQLSVNSGIIAFTCYFVLAACLAYYPQKIVVHKDLLEQQFQNLKDLNNKDIIYFEFNKGL